MTSSYKAALAAAVAAVALLPMSAPASAGGFQGQLRGSMKDTMPVERSSYRPAQRPSYAHRCYWRGDVGYSYSTDPSAAFDSPVYAANHVNNSSVMDSSNEHMDGGWMFETGLGCGSGSRGFRADLTIGYRGERDITGNKPDILNTHFPGTFETKLSTLTAMANVYYDFGKMRGFVPYVGVGLGIAHHDLSDVSFALANPATGRRRLPIISLGPLKPTLLGR